MRICFYKKSSFRNIGSCKPYVCHYVANLIAIAMATIGILLPSLSVRAQTCVAPVSGITAWWPGDGDATDAVGTDNGTLQNGASFSGGEVNQAFSFDGIDDYISIPASSSLNVGPSAGMTIECWINPADVSREQAIV